MEIRITHPAEEYISELCSEMITSSKTEQPVLAIYFKGTTSAI